MSYLVGIFNDVVGTGDYLMINDKLNVGQFGRI